MQISPVASSAREVEADAVVVGIYQDEPLSHSAAEVDEATGGVVRRLVEAGEIKAEPLSVTAILAPAGIQATQLVVVGLGKREGLNRQIAFRAGGTAVKALAKRERKCVAIYLGEGWNADLTEAGVAGAIVGSQGQDLYRKEKKIFAPSEMLWAGGEEASITSGTVLGEGVNLARQLVNQPPQEIFPESFANAAEAVCTPLGIEVEVWDEKKLEDERCGSLLAVARGSDRPPRLVMLRYRGGQQGAPTLALVGKGVTFDSGGYSIKPTDGMLDMKCDMAGAAAVVGALQSIARLQLPVNVTGYVGLVENLISGKSYKLGDVLHARSGKTIEVHNTDAEGRLVLADVLDVAVTQGVDKIIDLATLTGACVVALGNDIAGLMTNNEAWAGEVKAAADAAGEDAWPLPMHTFFSEQIKSEVADIKNVGEGRWGGAITAGKFLEEFVAGKPWVHLDIAGPAFNNKAKSWLDAGGSGCFVRTLVEVARKWA
jgi:leucyl aminopeptidase